jgi:hypothetical protein
MALYAVTALGMGKQEKPLPVLLSSLKPAVGGFSPHRRRRTATSCVAEVRPVRGSTPLTELLKDEVVLDLLEGRERNGPHDQSPQVVVALAEAKEVEDEGTGGDRLAEATEGIVHALRLATLLTDGEVSLDEDPKGSVEVKGMILTDVEELVDGNLGMMSSAATLTDDVLELDNDNTKDSR